VHAIASRFLDGGRRVERTFAGGLVGGGAGAAGGGAGAGGAGAGEDVARAGDQAALVSDGDASETGDDNMGMGAPNAAGVAVGGGGGGDDAVAATHTFVFDDGTTATVPGSLDESLQVTHPVTAEFARPSVCTDRVLRVADTGLPAAVRRDVWELTAPAVDLPNLSQRYLAHTALYDTYALYSQSVRATRDALEANPKGDLATLSSFFAERPELRDADKVAAARLTFDVLTRPDGRLPKATSETMAVFVDALAKSDQHLPLGSGTAVRVYNNLTYSGNYAMHVLEQFETIGTFNFHVEQFVTMLVLDGVLQRPRHEDDDEVRGLRPIGPPADAHSLLCRTSRTWACAPTCSTTGRRAWASPTPASFS
jgi:hypothetical protein